MSRVTLLRSVTVLAVTIWACCLELLVACASTSDQHRLAKYVSPPANGPAAEIIANGGTAKAMLKGISGHVAMIDDAESPSFATVIRVAPGTHRLGIDCLFTGLNWSGRISDSLLQHVAVTGAMLEGRKYYVRCGIVGDKPRTWLSDTPDGTELPFGFNAVCSRACEGFP